MPKKISDIALAKAPSFANRVSLFQSKLQITRHASGCIVDYSHALYKTVVYVIYDCGLRASEACRLQWNDIFFNRQQYNKFFIWP
jgi:integrase